ncbi:MAG: tyrosine-type recombinase/integrase, partial [Hyphomicrobium sp.]
MSERRSAVITLTAINGMVPGDIIHDTTLKGFGARRQKDAVSYFLKTRLNGKQRWVTIGRHGQPWTPDSARKHALQILADPSLADRPVVEASLTFAEVAAQFMVSHGPKLKPETRKAYQCRITLDLIPAFGPKPIDAISRGQISAAHARWSNNPSAANYSLAVLSKLMTWAEDQGYRPEDSNPCRRIQRYKENKLERFLQPDELARLGAALDKASRENLAGTYALAAIRLIILTGARLNEILTLQWSFIDLSRRIIFLPDSKTGKKPLILNDAAIDVLKALPRFANNPYVIVGRHGDHLVNLQKPWRTVRALADLNDVRIHDLRHTFASVAVASGGSLPILGRQLGHS